MAEEKDNKPAYNLWEQAAALGDLAKCKDLLAQCLTNSHSIALPYIPEGLMDKDALLKVFNSAYKSIATKPSDLEAPDKTAWFASATALAVLQDSMRILRDVEISNMSRGELLIGALSTTEKHRVYLRNALSSAGVLQDSKA
jgi:hypothetical protein